MGKYSPALQEQIKEQGITQRKRTPFYGKLVVHVSPDVCANGHINPSMLEALIDLMLQLENVDEIGYIHTPQQSLKTDTDSYLHGYPSRH